MYRALAIILGLLWPTVSLAWEKSCSGTDVTTLQLNPGGYACYDLDTTSTTDSGTLDVSQCENIDIFWNSIITANTFTNTVIARNCFTQGTRNANMCWAIENLTLTGNPADNTEAIYGASAVWLYADVQAHAASGTARMLVKCNGPK